MPLDPELPFDSLSDPEPPAPGRAQRTAVMARARQLDRRRRAVQGGGAVLCAAVIAVGVVAVVSVAGDSGGQTSKVETATAPDTTVAVDDTVAVTTTVPVVPTEPVAGPTDTETVAPAVPAEPEVEPMVETPPPAPVHASFSATVSGVPPGVILNAQLVGANGTWSTSSDTAVLSFSDIPPGDYQIRWDWQSPDGASAAGRIAVTITPDGNAIVS